MLTHESGKALVHINQDYNKKRNSRRRRGFSGTQAFDSVCFPHHFILVRELFSIYTLARHIPSNTGQSGISVDQTGFSWCCVNVCRCGGQTDFGCFPLSPFVCMWCVHTCGGWVDTVFLDTSPGLFNPEPAKPPSLADQFVPGILSLSLLGWDYRWVITPTGIYIYVGAGDPDSAFLPSEPSPQSFYLIF